MRPNLVALFVYKARQEHKSEILWFLESTTHKLLQRLESRFWLLRCLVSNPLVLLTGPNGFVGAHVLDELLKNNYRVRGTVRSLSKATFLQAKYSQACSNQDLTFVEIPDIQASGALDEAAQGVDFVCHVASPFFTATDDPIKELVIPRIEAD